MTRLVVNEEVYREFLLRAVPSTRRFLWIATADIKNMHVLRGNRHIPFLSVLSDLVKDGREVRLLHAKEPGERFRADFDRCDALLQSDLFERVLCPRVHFKCIIIDGKRAYVGSANFTGAGMGAKTEHRRNFEAGVDTVDRGLISGLMELFDAVFRGEHCSACSYRKNCPDPADQLLLNGTRQR